jgi:hypothetical protein
LKKNHQTFHPTLYYDRSDPATLQGCCDDRHQKQCIQVLEKFPGNGDDIKRLFKENRNFNPSVKITASAPKR